MDETSPRLDVRVRFRDLELAVVKKGIGQRGQCGRPKLSKVAPVFDGCQKNNKLQAHRLECDVQLQHPTPRGQPWTQADEFRWGNSDWALHPCQPPSHKVYGETWRLYHAFNKTVKHEFSICADNCTYGVDESGYRKKPHVRGIPSLVSPAAPPRSRYLARRRCTSSRYRTCPRDGQVREPNHRECARHSLQAGDQWQWLHRSH